jgi:hypothetical protein
MFDQFDMFLESPAIAVVTEPKAKPVTPKLALVESSAPEPLPTPVVAVIAEPAEKPKAIEVSEEFPMVITELAVGDPVKRRGYLGKYRGMWLSLIVTETAFSRFSEQQKEDMQGRLKHKMLAAFA